MVSQERDKVIILLEAVEANHSKEDRQGLIGVHVLYMNILP